MMFTILHLSDAHLGNPRLQLDSSFVLDALHRELRTMHETLGTPDLVIFSGDIVYGELATQNMDAQFALATNWVREVSLAVGLDPADPPWCFVPGNHDVNRTLVGSDQREWSQKASPETVYDTMSSNDIVWKRIGERLQQWSRFASQYRFLEYDPHLHVGTRVITAPFGALGIAALNTSWASSGDNEKGRLWLGKYQLQFALDKIKSAPVKIAITHHPTGWLNESEADVQHRIEANFSFHFHGHEHIAWVSASNRSIRIEAGASYSRSDKLPAYSWTTLDIERGEVAIHLRTYVDSGSGGWVPLILPGETDEFGVVRHSLPDAFPRRSNGTAPPTVASPAPAPARDLYSLIATLQAEYYFRWEQTHPPTSVPTVFWPVRLRRPSPIHAVQAFAAAAMAKLGVRVYLYVDDLGNQEFSIETLTSQLSGWFRKVGGDHTALTIRRFSDTFETSAESANVSWRMVERWLGRTHYDLEQVMRIAKLLPSDGEILRRRPRRLLSPPLVWKAMLALQSEIGDAHRVTTLGGYDERALWKAWRELAGEPSVCGGHLYVPELITREAPGSSTPVHMARTPLDWSSSDDVRDALMQDVSSDANAFSSPNRMFSWCFNGCVRLPEYVTQVDEASEQPIGEDDRERVIQLSPMVSKWLF